MKSYKFRVTGRVQGVYYRVSVQKNALKYHYKGYVKNMLDKSVEACVRCQESEVERFIEILKEGSHVSRVDNIEPFTCDEIFTDTFEVRQ